MRQFLYSLDAARLLVRLLDTYEEREPVILAPPEEYSIKELVSVIAKVAGFKGNIIYTDDQKQDGQMRKTADGSRVREMFPDFEYTPFEQALEETVAWYKNNM